MRTVAICFDPVAMDHRQRETLRGIARGARPGGWRLAIDPYADRRRPMPYDGIVATTRKGRGPGLATAGVPVVQVSWGLVHHDLVRVLENRYAAGRLAAHHLADHGCASFAYVGFAKQTQSGIEHTEFALQLRRRGLRVGKARTFVTYASSRRWWKQVMRRLGDWLERLLPPVGLLVARPDFARAIVDLAVARGLRIPQDLALVAADDDPVLCGLPPALTAVRFDYAEVGRRAAELLGHLMDGGRPPDRNILIPPTLVPRLSTDRHAVCDPLVDQALIWIERRCTERFDWRVLDTGESDRIGPRHVAEALGVSLRTLQHHFRRAGRRTVLQELAAARVEFAMIQLEGTDTPVRAVAHHSGFGSYPAFLRAFRKHVGLSPAAWRHQRGQAADRAGRRRS